MSGKNNYFAGRAFSCGSSGASRLVGALTTGNLLFLSVRLEKRKIKSFLMNHTLAAREGDRERVRQRESETGENRQRVQSSEDDSQHGVEEEGQRHGQLVRPVFRQVHVVDDQRGQQVQDRGVQEQPAHP